jgi:hypothetical protein
MDPNKFNSLENEVTTEKFILDQYMQSVLSRAPNIPTELLNKAHLQGTRFFSKFESFVTRITYWNVMTPTSEEVVSVPFIPAENFLKTSQLVLKTYRKEQSSALRKKFHDNRLPTKGFDSKGSFKLTSIKIDWVSLIIGCVLLITSGLLVFLMDIDTGMKYLFSRILISLSVALMFTGVAKEKIQARINIPGIAITALGTIAIFFTLYFANPAEMPTINNTDAHEGTILMPNK